MNPLNSLITGLFGLNKTCYESEFAAANKRRRLFNLDAIPFNYIKKRFFLNGDASSLNYAIRNVTQQFTSDDFAFQCDHSGLDIGVTKKPLNGVDGGSSFKHVGCE